MAIEDAVVLARCLAERSDPTTAFLRYERLRHGRTARVTNISRVYGAIGQWTHPAGAWLMFAILRLGLGKMATKNYAKFVNYDPYEIPLGAA